MSPQEPQENKTETTLRRVRDWFAAKADSAYAKVWLAFFAFAESSVLLIPPDPLLAALIFLHKERWLQYTAIAIAASLTGAVFGYGIGLLLYGAFGAPLIEAYGLTTYMVEVENLINESVFVFTLTAAFTPVPFIAAVLAAGFTKANFLAFFTAAVIGRSARYLLVGYVAKVFGDNAEILMRKFWWFATGVGILIIGLAIAYSLLF